MVNTEDYFIETQCHKIRCTTVATITETLDKHAKHSKTHAHIIQQYFILPHFEQVQASPPTPLILWVTEIQLTKPQTPLIMDKVRSDSHL